MKTRILKIGYQEYTFPPSTLDDDVFECYEILKTALECNYKGIPTGNKLKLELIVTETLSNEEESEDESNS